MNPIAYNACSLSVGVESNFDVISSAFATTQGISYDFSSLMHYSAYAFSRNGRPTIVPLDSSLSLDSLGQREDFSDGDLQHVKTLYCGECEREQTTTSFSFCLCLCLALSSLPPPLLLSLLLSPSSPSTSIKPKVANWARWGVVGTLLFAIILLISFAHTPYEYVVSIQSCSYTHNPKSRLLHLLHSSCWWYLEQLELMVFL